MSSHFRRAISKDCKSTVLMQETIESFTAVGLGPLLLTAGLHAGALMPDEPRTATGKADSRSMPPWALSLQAPVFMKIVGAPGQQIKGDSTSLVASLLHEVELEPVRPPAQRGSCEGHGRALVTSAVPVHLAPVGKNPAPEHTPVAPLHQGNPCTEQYHRLL